VLKSGSSDSGVKMVFQSFFMLIISIQPDYAAYRASGRAGGANPKGERTA
jgi:hypothetical protein